MSWDISIKVLGTDGKYYEVLEIGNYTYNVMPMYSKALGWDSLNHCLNGKQCSFIVDKLKSGIKKMQDNREEFVKLNPLNGWGNYTGALEYMKKILDGCKKFPEGIVVVQ